MKIAITWPINQSVVDKLKEKFDVLANPAEHTFTPEELTKFVAGADAILCLLTDKITREVMDAAGAQLKIVATMSMGFDHIDLGAAKAKNIVVTNTPGVLDNAVAEHTIALMLALAKSITQADAFVRSGQYKGWDPKLFVGPELNGKILGIVGLGHIGTTVAKIAGFGLGMAIAYNDMKPNPEFESTYNAKYFSLEELLPISDVVTLHCPLVAATHHLINAERLALMKPTAYLINTARGPVVDEGALVKVLLEEKIAGAGLDVYENEPNISPALLALKNVVLTPHTASATIEGRDAMALKAADNIMSVLSGQSAIDAVKG